MSLHRKPFAAARAGIVALAMAMGVYVETAIAQPNAPASAVGFERINVRGPSLEGNLEGNAADRSVYVFLPPSYARDAARRYPVVYALHGYSTDNDRWSEAIDAPARIAGAFSEGVREMIVVMPSAQSRHNGSMYSSSVTIGDWEGFITGDLVAYIDANYRTLPTRNSRGLIGHSMGGYGAARIGMKHPDVFSALYIMSPCCLSARSAPPADVLARLEQLQTPEQSIDLGFLDRATLAVAAAWSPNPNKPPFYLDLPIGDQQANVLARWAANAPLAMAEQNAFNLRQYRGVVIDVGDQDGLRVDAAELHRILTESKVQSTFEIYAGDHGNRVPERFQHNVLPFFARTLVFAPSEQ